MHTFYEDKNVQLSVFCFPFGIFCFPPTEGFIKIDELLQKQTVNAKKWEDRLFDMPSLIDFIRRDGTEPNYWVCGILSSNKEADMKMFKKQGYACSAVHLPNTYYSVFGKQDMPTGVEEFYNKFIALPSGWWM